MTNPNVNTGLALPGSEGSPENLTSMGKVAKIPVVESTINLAGELYCKVKDCSSMTNSVLSKAENGMHYAMDAAKPVTTSGPVKKVDALLSSGIDYIETNVPAVMLPPNEMFDKTKIVVCRAVEPAMKCVCSMKEYGQRKVTELYNELAPLRYCEHCRGLLEPTSDTSTQTPTK